MVDQRRPTSKFENFDAQTPERQALLANMVMLAEGLAAQHERICNEQYPFEHARLIMLWGKSGRGKTHLVEALLNYLACHTPDILGKIFLARTNFTLDNIASTCHYDNKPIVILDDLFGDHDSMSQLHQATDVRCLMEFIRKVYEERRLIIVTCNFPMMGGMEDLIRKVDATGKVVSRLRELLAYSGEVEIKGEDYREQIAQQGKSRSPFAV